jgi:deoxyribonuclease-4
MSAGSNGRPLQVFLANPRDFGQISELETTRMIGDVAPGTQLFIHASYFVNLSSLEHGTWSIERLRQELTGCRKLQGKGVVVHMGTYGSTTIPGALDRMEEGIRKALDSASPDCPIILETPAGEGTDLCASIEQLMLFYFRFNGDPRIRLCVDLCHVFAAGYDPSWYLQQWLIRWSDSIVLVHFNDSKKCRGSRVDRHHEPGLGHIGYKRMWQAHQICVSRSIPMVRE